MVIPALPIHLKLGYCVTRRFVRKHVIYYIILVAQTSAAKFRKLYVTVFNCATLIIIISSNRVTKSIHVTGRITYILSLFPATGHYCGHVTVNMIY